MSNTHDNSMKKNGVDECENCKSNNLTTIDSRSRDEGRRRRHKCLNCFRKFSTMEISIENFERYHRLAKAASQLKALLK